ncbi:hypothetical protein PVOR_16424 [Paenibacillus vortex V453]|uniref:DinB-like domain-containing protein n=1 Tax=Paenibacillus vortex V453 TaxID=715225 RepID=A0A2R9SU98_9BACL|nr:MULTISPECIES: DinB family protein [Paenibacillus]AWP27930.1 hypothetical protein B9D94_15440 [Paenibacillus sp. Cedars]EFU40938.1 hypothetical protein PVOR_16424 [Paenibacillus vortex V453]
MQGGHPISNPNELIRSTLDFQFQISWQMLNIHLTGLQDEEFHSRPAMKGLHVYHESGVWRTDWPETEEYEIGPPSISWLTWHITYWWSMVLDHSFGSGTLTREEVLSMGNIQETRDRINRLKDEWEREVAGLPGEALLSMERTRWPFEDRPFHELLAWLNIELMKNAAEIGYCRFLYAVSKK